MVPLAPPDLRESPAQSALLAPLVLLALLARPALRVQLVPPELPAPRAPSARPARPVPLVLLALPAQPVPLVLLALRVPPAPSVPPAPLARGWKL